ncbi:RNA-binding motif and ELMO domain-containing protein 1 [Takifugu flavidus]|uniref:RNA-binding motif and ELMO domain-containing protein 1 n=1 Tax=Takifugu flavidus TaxID=433684 RepID=A0A5C6N262_9TELE|nr:RNA-binding motif and ELMO domain-containing protein 1 [Takifugu flavidus]
MTAGACGGHYQEPVGATTRSLWRPLPGACGGHYQEPVEATTRSLWGPLPGACGGHYQEPSSPPTHVQWKKALMSHLAQRFGDCTLDALCSPAGPSPTLCGSTELSCECKPLEEITNGHSNLKSVRNGLVPGGAGRDPVVPSAALTPLPISTLKQNGLLQTLSAGGGQAKPAEENPELEKARQEWEALENIQPALPEDLNPTPIISFNEALQYFQTTDLGDVRVRTAAALLKYEDTGRTQKSIQPTVRRTGLAAITHFLFGPPRLHRELVEERDLVFAIAQCQMDNSQTVHMRVLQTIYKRLLGSRLDCPRYGSHWENIGFQGTRSFQTFCARWGLDPAFSGLPLDEGTDPATDLRGTGFLGLMHTLYLVMDPETLPLARDIYRLSQHRTQNFPFSVMSINMTRIALQVLREEALSKECNRRQQVVGVLNEFYVATFLHLFQLWKGQQKTIAESGTVLKGQQSGRDGHGGCRAQYRPHAPYWSVPTPQYRPAGPYWGYMGTDTPVQTSWSVLGLHGNRHPSTDQLVRTGVTLEQTPQYRPAEVELFAKKNPKQMLRRLELFLKARQAGSPPGGSPDPQAQPASPGLGHHQARGSQGKELHFTGVCDLPPDMEGEARLI